MPPLDTIKDCRYARRKLNILDGRELCKDGAGLSLWTEIPNVFLVHGGFGTALDEGVDPAKGDPLEDGNIVFWGILDRLDVYIWIRRT